MIQAVIPPESATTEPTDKSKAPDMSKIIMPMATMVSMERFNRTWEKLLKVGNMLGYKMLATIHTSTIVMESVNTRSCSRFKKVLELLLSVIVKRILLLCPKHNA